MRPMRAAPCTGCAARARSEAVALDELTNVELANSVVGTGRAGVVVV